MEKLPQEQEIPNLQKIKLEKFLDEEKITFLFDRGYDDMSGSDLKIKFTEFFDLCVETNFEKRLKNAFHLFEKQLKKDDHLDTISRVASLCIPISKVIEDRSSEIHNLKN